jgi:hypothetical protein
MEQYGFKPRNRLMRIEHVEVTSRLLSWMLEIDQVRLHNWIAKSEDHVDFCDYS